MRQLKRFSKVSSPHILSGWSREFLISQSFLLALWAGQGNLVLLRRAIWLGWPVSFIKGSPCSPDGRGDDQKHSKLWLRAEGVRGVTISGAARRLIRGHKSTWVSCLLVLVASRHRHGLKGKWTCSRNSWDLHQDVKGAIGRPRALM